MQNFKYPTLEVIKPLIRTGDYVLITEMLKGIYTQRAVEAQLRGERTLKEPVVEAANKLFELRESLISTRKNA
jgi:hypothetical protein